MMRMFWVVSVLMLGISLSGTLQALANGAMDDFEQNGPPAWAGGPFNATGLPPGLTGKQLPPGNPWVGPGQTGFPGQNGDMDMIGRPALPYRNPAEMRGGPPAGLPMQNRGGGRGKRAF